MRVNIELPKDRYQELIALKTETETESLKELLVNALAMLEWAVGEAKMGNEVASFNRDDKTYRVFVTPLLLRVVRKYARKGELVGAPAPSVPSR